MVGIVPVALAGHKAAADFLLDEKNGMLVLPDMTAGTLSYYKL